MIQPPHLVGCLKKVEQARAQREIIWQYHLGPTNHRGLGETVVKLSRQYYWQGMNRTIAAQLKRCGACKRNKLQPEKQVTHTPHRPSEVMWADVFTFNGHKYLTVLDRFTKEVWAWALRNKSAREVERALSRCFARVESPQILILDRGREFYKEWM